MPSINQPKKKALAMPYSTESTVKELLDNAQTRAFIEEKMPELLTHPALGMIRGMSLRAIAPFSGGKLNDEALAAIDEALQKLG